MIICYYYTTQCCYLICATAIDTCSDSLNGVDFVCENRVLLILLIKVFSCGYIVIFFTLIPGGKVFIPTNRT